MSPSGYHERLPPSVDFGYASPVLRPLVLVASLLSAIAPAAAAAQAEEALAEGIAAYEEGRFADASARLDAAAAGEGLSRRDLVRLLATRVLVAQALGDDAALDTALLQLVTLDPSGLGDAASPALARRTERALQQTGGATLTLAIEHRASGDGLLVRARLRGDVGALARHVRIRAREGGDEGWIEGPDGELTLPRAEAVDVEVIAVAVGPGGAPVANVGTVAAPHRLVRPVPAAALEAEAETEGGGDDGVLIGVLVGVGVAVVAAAVVLGVVLSQGAQDTSLGGPVIEW